MFDNLGMFNIFDFILKKEDYILGNLLLEYFKVYFNVYMVGYKGEYLGLFCCIDSMLIF